MQPKDKIPRERFLLSVMYFPKKLKLANITPVYKKETLAENYGPASALPCVSKASERIIQRQLSSFIDEFL